MEADEKIGARVRAYNNLVEQLRIMKPSPIDIRTDEKLSRQQNRLYFEIEKAYNLNRRPGNALISDLAQFMGTCR